MITTDTSRMPPEPRHMCPFEVLHTKNFLPCTVLFVNGTSASTQAKSDNMNPSPKYPRGGLSDQRRWSWRFNNSHDEIDSLDNHQHLTVYKSKPWKDEAPHSNMFSTLLIVFASASVALAHGGVSAYDIGGEVSSLPFCRLAVLMRGGIHRKELHRFRAV